MQKVSHHLHPNLLVLLPEAHKANKVLCTFLELLYICKIKTRYDGPTVSFPLLFKN